MLSETLRNELSSLTRVEKLRVVQMLIAQIADEEAPFTGQEYAVWSPYDAPDAAVALLKLLKSDGSEEQ
jgi:hypothetical protein